MGDYRAKLEFQAPYKGDADQHLEAYVTKCWLSFCNDRPLNSSPHVTLVQSSGFGKSRSLYELARRTKDSPHMKVTYMCARMNAHSSGYPLSTPSLHSYWFHDRNVTVLVTRLCGLFDNSMAHWDQAGDEWMRVFTEYRDADTMKNRLASFEASDIPPSDEKPHDTAATYRVIVFAVDVARDLGSDSYSYISDRSRLQQALAIATTRIQARYGKYAGILALLVDNDPSIIRRSDPFPPYVPTQNVDVFFNETIRDAQASGISKTEFYQQLVCAPESEARSSMTKMGRPLWWSLEDDRSFDNIVQLASSKLLVGLPAGTLTHETLYGMSTMTARLGTLELSHSPNADHSVASAMATLLVANNVKVGEKVRGAYLSEPIVAFGATKTWYHVYRDMPKGYEFSRLVDPLLPRLRELEEVKMLDGGGRGRLAASIVMLLAIDTTGVVVTGNMYARYYDGAFYSVATFLTVLTANTSEVEDVDGKPVEDGAADVIEQSRVKWSKWKVGFGQFVPLSTMPSEDVLWMLLSRRAAGVLSSTPEGVSLVIPIFQDQPGTAGDGPTRRVSSIRVCVANFAGGDPAFPGNMATPVEDENAIRVYMNLRGPKKPRRFFLRTPNALVVCLEGLQEQTARGQDAKPVSFLSKCVVAELVKLATPDFEDVPVMQIIMDVAAAKGNAARPLIDAMLGGKWQETQQTATESAAAEDAPVATPVGVTAKHGRDGDEDSGNEADNKAPRLE